MSISRGPFVASTEADRGSGAPGPEPLSAPPAPPKIRGGAHPGAGGAGPAAANPVDVDFAEPRSSRR